MFYFYTIRISLGKDHFFVLLLTVFGNLLRKDDYIQEMSLKNTRKKDRYLPHCCLKSAEELKSVPAHDLPVGSRLEWPLYSVIRHRNEDTGKGC